MSIFFLSFVEQKCVQIIKDKIKNIRESHYIYKHIKEIDNYF